MRRIHDGILAGRDLEKASRGVAIRVYSTTRTQLILLTIGGLMNPDGRPRGLERECIDKPRILSDRERLQRHAKLGRPLATWLFENNNWNLSAMLGFVDDVHENLRADGIYKGTSLGSHNNEVSFQARVLKEGFSNRGIQVHAPPVVAWTAEAILAYAQRIHVALKKLPHDYHLDGEDASSMSETG